MKVMNITQPQMVKCCVSLPDDPFEKYYIDHFDTHFNGVWEVLFHVYRYIYIGIY